MQLMTMVTLIIQSAILTFTTSSSFCTSMHSSSPENQKYGSSHHPWKTDINAATTGCLYKSAIYSSTYRMLYTKNGYRAAEVHTNKENQAARN
jgi:hypothetical protein